jgi:hypothetical protein
MNKIENANLFVTSSGFAQMARDKIKEFDEEIHWADLDLDRQYLRRRDALQDEVWLLDSIIESSKDNIEMWKKEKRRFQFLLDKANGGERKGSFDIEQIKQIPIDTLLGTPKWVSGNRAKYSCFAHDEKTPSLVWYRDQNKVYCYGCGFYGTVIDVYMKLNGCDFKSACKALSP